MSKVLNENVSLMWQEKIFYAVINTILFLGLMAVMLPMINIIVSSVSSPNAIVSGKVFLWPVGFTLEGFKAVFREPNIGRSIGNSLIYTFFGTLFHVSSVLVAAYPLSRKDLPGRNYIMIFLAITMYIGGGFIPTYLLMKDLGFINNPLVMIIPGAFNVWGIIIVRTFYQSNIPQELLDSAQIDGCSDFAYFFKMVLPLSKPIIAVNMLFAAVGHWNSFFNAFIYLNNKNFYPLQIILREILVNNTINPNALGSVELQLAQRNLAELLKYSLIIVTCLPVWCIYPFVQKHFVKGMLIGSIKG